MTKNTVMAVLVVALSGCAYTVFAPPAVQYSDGNSIGVKYRSAGVQSLDESEKAMKLISDHCVGSYKVTNRSEDNGWTTVDAECE